MKGFVNFVNEKFGFLVFSSTESTVVLDRELFVLPSGCIFERGQAVEFDIAPERGRDIATNVRPYEEERLFGVISSVNRRSAIIEANDRFGDNQRVPFVFGDVLPDSIGRIKMAVGTAVSFVSEFRAGSEYAVRVRNEDLNLQNIDPLTFQETGQVIWFQDGKGRIARPNGDEISFFGDKVLEGVELIRAGVWMAYSIITQPNVFDRKLRKFWHRIFAVDLQVCTEETQPEVGSIEEIFLSAPELALSESNKPIWTPEERNLPIREIINRRKSAA